MKQRGANPQQAAAVLIDGDNLTIEDIVDVARNGRRAELSPGAVDKVQRCRAWIDQVAEEGELTVYGVNTGFGALAEVQIARDKQERVSANVIASHSAGVGPPLAEEVVRATMLIRANTLAKGYSGIRLATLQTLLEMLNKGVHPVLPEKGSVGASGDLAPLSHLALVLGRCLDCGEAFYQGRRLPAQEAMDRAGIERVVLGAKEGIALNNGATVSAAVAALALRDAENLVKNSQIALGMSLEAVRGVSDAFRPEVHVARGHEGQIRCAANVLRLVEGSDLIDSAGRVQDAYSLRCGPQVIGAVSDALAFVRFVLSREINAATDNPLIFPDLPASRANKAVSCGNFHGEPVALAMDMLGMAVAEIGNISERRIFRLTDSTLSAGLPAMLVEESGLNSGFMVAQYTCAALVSDNKTLAHPDSVDSIPTCANQEDHVSMSMNAARHASEIVWNVEQIVGTEILCAAQALDFRCAGLEFSTTTWQREPSGERVRKIVEYELREGRRVSTPALGVGTKAAHETIRREITHLSSDRPLNPDLTRVAEMVHSGEILRAVEAALETTLQGLPRLMAEPE